MNPPLVDGLHVRRYSNQAAATALLVRAVRQAALNADWRSSCCAHHRPDRREVVLLARIWEDKIALDHPELAGHLDAVSETVANPDHLERDTLPARRRFYRRNVGPSRRLMVVVSYEQESARIIIALANRTDPKTIEAVNIHIGPLAFDRADYDADGDVLSLHLGPPQSGEGEETPEGHVRRFAPGSHRIVGLTIINAVRS